MDTHNAQIDFLYSGDEQSLIRRWMEQTPLNPGSIEVPEGFTFEDCNGLVRDDQTDFEITWGPERNNLARFVGQKVRLHIQTDAAGSLYSYRFGV